MSTKKREHHHTDHTRHAEKRMAPSESYVPVVQAVVSDEERSRMIQISAYGLWEQAGKPEGDAARVQFWCEAEKLIMAGHEPG